MLTGTRLGVYEVQALLGAGGMGEVYRAHDTKLGRDVAIKILPEALAQDPERRTRFEREARMLAALHHPHIAQIFGLEGQDGRDGQDGSPLAIVMELVEGPTLAERLDRGPLALTQVLTIARQLADALDAAHERGIVHRDLKPANIKIAKDGSVKVLDFGLAMPVAGDGAANAATARVTEPGTIVGTAAYMSPEQARGQAVDKRTDIWAFGCVLFEMLTGKPAFGGATASDILARILEREPSWDALPAATPAGVARLLERCLDKDPKRRVRDIGDAGREIDELIAASSRPGAPQGRAGRAPRWAGALALVALTAAATAWAVWRWMPRPSPAAPVSVARLVVSPEEPLALSGSGGGLVISPDGRRLAFVAGTDVRRRLFVRAIDQYDSKAIPGTEGADSPGFSPDGERLAFVAGGQLKTVALAGGSPQVLCDVTEAYGLDWTADDTIYFSRARGSGIWRIRVAGGRPEEVTRLGPRDDQHRFPNLLPGGKALLFSSLTSSFEQQVFVQSLVTGERHPVSGGVAPRYLQSGQVVFVQGGTLYAVPFDPVRLEATGMPVAVFQGVREVGYGRPQITFSSTGTMAYVATSVADQDSVVWVDRHGAEQATGLSGRHYQMPRLSPDGRMVAVQVSSDNATANMSDLWLYDLGRATLSRLTFDNANSFPLWSPDGRRVAFSSVGNGPPTVRTRTFDGSGPEEELLKDGQRVNRPLTWSPDGDSLALVRANPSTANDIWVMDTRSRSLRPFVDTKFREGGPTFSHDGRWIAYVSDQSGRNEVYMRPFPGPGGGITISTEGGNEPVWARRTGQLFYRQGSMMMAVDIVTQPSLLVGKPYVLFSAAYNLSQALWPNYDVTPDGQRLLMVKGNSRGAPPQINVVLNWRPGS